MASLKWVDTEFSLIYIGIQSYLISAKIYVNESNYPVGHQLKVLKWIDRLLFHGTQSRWPGGESGVHISVMGSWHFDS